MLTCYTFFRKTIRMWTFEAKKLALELKVLRSQTRCQLRLEKNKVIFLTLIKALPAEGVILPNCKHYFQVLICPESVVQ